MSDLTAGERESLRLVSGCCVGCPYHGLEGANDNAWRDVCEAVNEILRARDAWK